MNIKNNLPKICVVIRKRPLNKKQILRGQKDIIQISNNNTILVKQDKVKIDLTPYTDQYKFIFDAAYDQTKSNQEIYEPIVRPLIYSAYDGARVSCFAYGQTGSGKTHTMLGDRQQNVRGLYLLAAYDVFYIQNNQCPDISVYVSFYQIYCGKLYDLLNDRNILHAREDAKNNVNIVGLSERKIQSVQQVMNTIQFGINNRVTSQNSTNSDSSRSHGILQITLKRGKKVHGKISFIDLAGSQRAADHADQTDKQTRIDGAQINKSLLALKQCIRALDQNKCHLPFRGSKLTMVLKDSFIGYCQSVMIGNISPNSFSCQNTLNTLKYADRVKQLKKANKIINQGDYLNNLSKQLMLPRQLISHQHVSKNQDNLEQYNMNNHNNHNNQNNMNKKHNNYFEQNNLNINNINNIESKYRKNSQDIYNNNSHYNRNIINTNIHNINNNNNKNNNNNNNNNSKFINQDINQSKGHYQHTNSHNINNVSNHNSNETNKNQLRLSLPSIKPGINKTNYSNSPVNHFLNKNNTNNITNNIAQYHNNNSKITQYDSNNNQNETNNRKFIKNTNKNDNNNNNNRKQYNSMNINNNISNDNNKNLQQIYSHLGQRHQQMMEKVISDEQKLLNSHQNFINFQVQMTKNHIQTMNQSDKIGSTIQKYLFSLEGSLQQQISQIYKLKAQIQNLKYSLDQAKKIQALYMQVNVNQSQFLYSYDPQSRKMQMELNQQQEQDLLFDY